MNEVPEVTPGEKAEALEKSITHWRANESADDITKVFIYSDDCALCELFCVDTGEDTFYCKGCPVAESGEGYHGLCEGTPWEKARDAFKKWLCCSSPPKMSNDPPEKSLRENFQNAAREEREFLESLREKEPEMSRHLETEDVNIEMTLHGENLAFIKASDDGEDAHGVWLSKSKIKIHRDSKIPSRITVSMPEWLAIEKGLV